MSGFATVTNPGNCNDKLTVAGMSGVNPPEICGTNTGYHSKIAILFYFLLSWTDLLLNFVTFSTFMADYENYFYGNS